MPSVTKTEYAHPFPTAWRRFVLAVTFLTRMPLPVQGEVTPADLRASMGWYPVVGMALGLVGVGLYRSGSRYFPATVAAVLVIILLEAFTGALHLDGLMDTCDGVGSGKPRERALEIMKDSRVGAMGVFGAVAMLLVKVTALAALPAEHAIIPLAVGWSAARVIPSLDVVLFRYARPTGTAGAFTEGRSPWPTLVALLLALAGGFLLGGWVGLSIVVGVIAVTLCVQAGIAEKLGGLTGDVYGMGIELSEALALLAGCVLASWKFI